MKPQKKNELAQLRTLLFDCIQKVKQKKMKPQDAIAINVMARTIIQSGRLELDFIRTNAKNSVLILPEVKKISE